jgi:hypothetical protein
MKLRHLLVASLCLLCGFLGWRMAATAPHPLVIPRQTQASATQVKRPALPAPKIALPVETKSASTAAPGKPEGPLAQLFKDNGKLLKLSAEQLTGYLAQNQRSAESLLAAMRLTGDISYLREAAQKFPNDTAVQTEMALRSGDAGERRRAIDAMRQTDPDNALGHHLSALDHLRQGHVDEAYTDLIAAAGKSRFDDYALQAQQSAEEAYLAAGYSPVEAKAAAMLGLQRRQIEPMRALSKQLTELNRGYSAAGDPASADSVRQMGQALGQQMQSHASYLIDELVGITIERQFLPKDDTIRQQELQQRVDAIRKLSSSPHWTALLEGSNAAEISLYLDRLKLYGEAATIQWLIQRHAKR